MVVSPDGTVLYVPEFVTEHIGLTQAEMIGQSLVDLTHSEDQNSVERNLIYDPTGGCCCLLVLLFVGVVVCWCLLFIGIYL